MLFDRGYPSFGNFDSTIPIDVVGMKSCKDSLFDPSCVPEVVMITKINLAPNRNMPCLASVLRNRIGARKNGVSERGNGGLSTPCTNFLMERIFSCFKALFLLSRRHEKVIEIYRCEHF